LAFVVIFFPETDDVLGADDDEKGDMSPLREQVL
jgi:hypothetical protein